MFKRNINISFKWEWDLLRQTPGRSGQWQDSKFTINQQSEQAQIWIVYEDLSEVTTMEIPSANVILMTAEPKVVKSYSQGFIDQFAMICTTREDIVHHNKRLMNTALPWFTGRTKMADGTIAFLSDYDSLKNYQKQNNDKLASMICSDKSFTEEHAKRLNFAKTAKEAFGDRLKFYGRGLNEFNDKAEILRSYRYHIVLENSKEQHYWTEKLSDCFLNDCYPIYFGCPNIFDYFPRNSLSTIDIDDIATSLQTIEIILGSNFYEQRANLVSEAKTLCLDRYNLFPLLHELAKQLDTRASARSITIKPQCYFDK